jgi:putative endonuclease
MSKTEKQQLGDKGEKAARYFLEKKGHTIVQTNYRYKHLEIDIISALEHLLIVSEVKSYFKPPLGAAEYRVNKKKQENLITAAQSFIYENQKYQEWPVRFDVIIVNYSVYPLSVRHYEGAFWADHF